MLKHPDIAALFRCLTDPTRRLLVERLGRGPATVSDLARPFDMTLAAVVQHLKALEQAGLIRSEKIGRVRTCQINTAGLDVLAGWVAARRHPMELRLDRLGEMFADNPETPSKSPSKSPTKSPTKSKE